VEFACLRLVVLLQFKGSSARALKSNTALSFRTLFPIYIFEYCYPPGFIVAELSAPSLCSDKKPGVSYRGWRLLPLIFWDINTELADLPARVDQVYLTERSV
jgi:hypothetical protein